MKTTIQSTSTKLFALLVSLLTGFYAVAQDASSTSSSTVSHTETNGPATDATMWYSNPIVWIIGAVVLLIIIIAAAKSGKKNVSNSEVSRTTTTTTTVKED